MNSLLRLFLGTIFCGLTAFGPIVAEDPGWPREIQHERGEIVVYQPQVESLDGDDLRARAAVSVKLKEAEPVFGVLWTTARIRTDRDERTVQILDVQVTDVRFPEATEDQQNKLGRFIETEATKWNLTLSLDRLLASLAALEETHEISSGLEVDPPAILYADSPAVLVVIDGEPRYVAVKDSDLRRVANTPYTVIRDVKNKTFYLDGGVHWYTAKDIMGPWTVDKKPPKKVRKLRSEEATQAALDSVADKKDYVPPRVIIVTDPTELLATEGKAEYAPLGGSGLLYVSNTESDLILDTATQKHFLVLSGRWYTSKRLEGPWGHVASEELPASFGEIPAESPRGNVRVYVAGTQEAREALMDNQIPQTAAVKRGRASLSVTYDGEPRFQPVEGTDMEYAVNTSFSVLKIDGTYWVCHSAVWYSSSSPRGPWDVAASRPAEVEKIPPSNPHYNTKYVYVYDSTPEVVYVGYTPSYVGSYAYGGCVVYGTGWHYPGWYGSYYYPHASTWGFHMSYNPWYGWGASVSWSNGPFTISFGGYGGGGYGYPGYYPYGMWGPRGYAYAYPHAHRPPSYYRPPGGSARPRPGAPETRPGSGTRPGEGARPDRGSIDRPEGGRDNLYKRPENRERLADRGAGGGREPGAAQNRPNDVFAGRDGNVYRRGQDGGWQQRDKSGWKGADPSRADRSTRQRDRSGSSAGSRSRGSGLENSYGARQRGSQRSRGFQGSRSGAGRSHGSMGGARGGRRR